MGYHEEQNKKKATHALILSLDKESLKQVASYLSPLGFSRLIQANKALRQIFSDLTPRAAMIYQNARQIVSLLKNFEFKGLKEVFDGYSDVLQALAIKDLTLNQRIQLHLFIKNGRSWVPSFLNREASDALIKFCNEANKQFLCLIATNKLNTLYWFKLFEGGSFPLTVQKIKRNRVEVYQTEIDLLRSDQRELKPFKVLFIGSVAFFITGCLAFFLSDSNSSTRMMGGVVASSSVFGMFFAVLSYCKRRHRVSRAENAIFEITRRKNGNQLFKTSSRDEQKGNDLELGLLSEANMAQLPGSAGYV